MRGEWYQYVLGWWLIGTLLLITGIDAIALMSAEPDKTVSRWFFDLGQSHPWVYLLVGVALGHILFPLLVRDGQSH